ncbi:MAG: LysR family transcriptional regulator [Burkholderiales bacterium]|nr:LysR family transcriptional regulator [Burkholderiales bacterium]
MDRLQTMAAFVAVLDNGGFAAAARRLGVSPPVVTRAVADLEERLGVRLFTRTTRVVRATEAGERYGLDCRRILAEIDEADEAAAGMHAAPRGTVQITAPVLFGRLHVMPIVTAYLERYPEADVGCLFVDRVVDLLGEGVDVGIRIGELADSSLQAVAVGRVRRVVCAAPSYLRRHGTPRSPADLARHCVISAAGVTPSTVWAFTRGGAAERVAVRPRLAVSSNDSAIAAAEAGVGLTRVLSYQVAEAIDDGRLKPVLVAFEPPPVPVHVVHREGRHAVRRVRAFLDLVIARLRADPSLG